MNYRQQHKTILKNILESVVFEGNNLVVTPHYTTVAPNGRDPFVFIVSAGLQKTDKLSSSNNYCVLWFYQIVFIFTTPNSDGIQENRIDELESLVFLSLKEKTTRDNPAWLDCRLVSVSPTHDPNFILQDNQVAKIFEVEIETVVEYV